MLAKICKIIAQFKPYYDNFKLELLDENPSNFKINELSEIPESGYSYKFQ